MPTPEQYADLLAQNERLRDDLNAATTELSIFRYWMARILRGERDPISLAQLCQRDIDNAAELYDDTEARTPPRAEPPFVRPHPTDPPRVLP